MMAGHAMSRLLVRLAGWVHPPRAEEWLNDLLYLQGEPGEPSGLGIAISHLLAAPGLSLEVVVGGLRARTVALEPLPLGRGHGYRGDGYAAWVWFQAEESSEPEIHGEAIYMLACGVVREPEIVDFVRDRAGTVQGVIVQGATSRGTIIPEALYRRPRTLRRRKWSRAWGDELLLADEEMMEALQHLADMTDSFGFDFWVGDRLTVTFPYGEPGGWKSPYAGRGGFSGPADRKRLEKHAERLRRRACLRRLCHPKSGKR
jgi:hypothetical protein